MNQTGDKDLAKTIRRWIVGVLSFVLVAMVGTFLIWRTVLSSQVNTRLKRLKGAGYPINASELNAWYSAVSEEENAALLFLKAADEIDKLHAVERDISAWLNQADANTALPPELKVRLQASLEANRSALNKLHAAAQKTKSRYPVDLSKGLNDEFKHLERIKAAASLLRAEALQYSDDGKMDAAVESIRVVYRLGDSLTDEPIFLSQLVRIAIYAIGTSGLERVLTRGPASTNVLRAVMGALENADDPRGLVRGLAGDRAAAIPVIQLKMPLPVPPGDEGEVRLPSEMTKGLMRTTGFFDRDLRFYLDAMETNLAIAVLPAPASFRATNQIDALSLEARRKYYIFSGLMLPSVQRALLRQARHEAGIRNARTALAIELYRAEHGGERPTSLTDLLPGYLKEIPRDPFDGKPLRYNVTQRGYIVYSIGPDAEDDGGKKETPGKKRVSNQEPFDITITVDR